MKLKKIDVSGVKSYLFQKGERIGLAICAVIGLLLLGMGLMKAGGSSLPYADTLKKAWVNMKGRIDVPEDPEKKLPSLEDLKKGIIVWDLKTKDFPDPAPFIDVNPDFVDNKRQNPTIFKVLDDDKHLQVDFFRTGYLAYELKDDKVWAFDKAVQGGNDAGQGGSFRLVRTMKPARFIVVTGVFPWKDQMDEFRRKLHYATMAELMAKPEDMPKPLGLNVYRCEVLAGGKEFTKWETVFKWDAKEEKLEKAQRIEDLFREAILDVDEPGKLTTGKHLQSGLMTPLPELANPNLHYPKLNLQGIKQDETKKGKKPQPNQRKGPGIFGPQSGGRKGVPGSGGGIQQEVKFVLEPWTKFSQPLQDQFNGKIGYFDPYGITQESAQANVPGNSGLQGQRPANKDEKIALEDVVVRFIDVNVEPGKTYMYTFAVRMANPNFGKKEVAFNSLAADKELVSEFTTTPPKSIPGEYYYYAVDQKPDLPIPDGSDTKAAVADYPTAYGKWTTPVQVHRWLGKTDDKEKVVADWAIAERLLTRRGDSIGRYGVMTEVLVWDKAKEAFEIGVKYLNSKKKSYTGLPIDFIQPADRGHPPLLVDFEGGWKTNVKIGTASLISKDESAVEMLILTPAGKLEVRNSRNDTDLDNPVAQERHTRWENWLKGIRNVNNAGGGNAMPGG